MCVSPYIARRKDGSPVAVPCGHCLQCLRDFQKQWTFRLSQEVKRTVLPLFITLTYNDAHVPLGEDEYGNIETVLVKSDFQRFMKRFRRYNSELTKDCRYFAIGEYGSRKNRCHFHAVLVLPNITSLDLINRPRLVMRKLHDIVKKSWTINGEEIGFVKVNRCEEHQIQYVCKYLNKLDARPHLVKPFRLMSRSIGLNFLSSQMVNYYLTTFDRTVVNGKARINLPRYYRDKLDEFSQRDPKYWMLQKAGLTYSDLLPKPVFKTDSLRGQVTAIQRDFNENFGHYYEECLKDIIHKSRVCGYQFYEPTDNQVYRFVVDTNKILQDAIRLSVDALNESCIRNKIRDIDVVGYDYRVTPEELEYDDS